MFKFRPNADHNPSSTSYRRADTPKVSHVGTVDMSLFDLTFYEKQVRGSLFGSSNPQDDVPKLLSLYCSGLLKLDELVDREYRLEELNEGYEDMLAGRNIRGLIRF